MSSNADSAFLPRTDEAEHSMQPDHAFFQNNNAFGGYDPALATGTPDTFNFANSHDWNYQSQHLGLSHGHDPQASLYQGWHTPAQQQQQQHNLNNQSVPHNFNDFYGGSFQQTARPTGDGTFDASNDFRYPVQAAGYDLPTRYTPTPQSNNYSSDQAVYPDPTSQVNTIAPGALQSRPSQYATPSSISQPKQEQMAKPKFESPVRDGSQIQVPKGVVNGKFVIVTPESLMQAASCRRFNNFLYVGDQLYEVPITKTTIPAYIPRKSRNEIQKLLADDSGLTAKLTKKPRKGSIIAPRAAARRSETPIAGKPANVKAASSEDLESSDEDSDSDSEEESMHPPIPAVRPARAIEAVKYDTIKTLWRVPYRTVEGDDIRKGLTAFWDIVRTIRDRWKSDTAAVKEAEEAKKIHEVPLLKERVMNQRDMLEVALEAAVAQGHRDIIEHLGENLPLMLSLAQFLQDRVRELDYSGSLSRVILKLLSRCVTLTEGSLEKTGIGKFLTRFQKRGDDEMKTLARRIADNASSATKKRRDTPRVSTSTAKDVRNQAPSAPKAVSPIAGVKRARPGEAGNEQPVKKMATDATKPPNGVKRPAAGMDGKAQGSAAAPVAKKAALPAKTTNFFQSLQSAKRPSTTASAAPNSNQVKAVASAEDKPLSRVAQLAQPASSFMDILAKVGKAQEPEQAPVVRQESAVPTETAEERTKRLRKEARRKLRVSWKPDSSLLQIKEFEHDADEEYGFEANQVRDAKDLDSEGRMFKMKSHQDMMELDDEDEPEPEPSVLDDHFQPFPEPTLVDFSSIPEEEKSKLYAPYGGSTVLPESSERSAQEQREANTLIVMYADRSDIPPTPREPAESTEDYKPPKEFGRPPQTLLEKIAMLNRPQAPAAPVVNTPLIPPALAALLGQMPQAAAAVPPQQIAVQNPTANEAKTDLEKVFAQYSLPAAQQQQTPVPQQQQQQPPPQQFPDLSAFLGMPQNTFNPFPVDQNQNQNQNQGQGQMPPLNQATLSAMLSALSSGNAAGMPPMPPMPGMPPMPLPGMPNMMPGANGMPDFSQMGMPFPGFPGMPPFPGFPGMTTGNQVQNRSQQQPSATGGFENPERRRIIQSGGDGDDDGERSGYGGKRKGGGWRNGNGEPPKFVVQCKYYKEGKCRKGDKCTFLHTD